MFPFFPPPSAAFPVARPSPRPILASDREDPEGVWGSRAKNGPLHLALRKRPYKSDEDVRGGSSGLPREWGNLPEFGDPVAEVGARKAEILGGRQHDHSIRKTITCIDLWMQIQCTSGCRSYRVT